MLKYESNNRERGFLFVSHSWIFYSISVWIIYFEIGANPCPSILRHRRHWGIDCAILFGNEIETNEYFTIQIINKKFLFKIRVNFSFFQFSRKKKKWTYITFETNDPCVSLRSWIKGVRGILNNTRETNIRRKSQSHKDPFV